MKDLCFIKKDGTIKVGYMAIVNNLCLGANTVKEDVFKLKYWTKSNGHWHLVDGEYWKMRETLDCLGIRYEMGNDSPKGGQEGDYIKVKYDKRGSGVKYLLSNFKPDKYGRFELVR